MGWGEIEVVVVVPQKVSSWFWLPPLPMTLSIEVGSWGVVEVPMVMGLELITSPYGFASKPKEVLEFWLISHIRCELVPI